MEHQLLQISNWKTYQLIQLFGVFSGEVTQLDQEYYHLFYYSVAYTEELYAKIC